MNESVMCLAGVEGPTRRWSVRLPPILRCLAAYRVDVDLDLEGRAVAAPRQLRQVWHALHPIADVDGVAAPVHDAQPPHEVG